MARRRQERTASKTGVLLRYALGPAPRPINTLPLRRPRRTTGLPALRGIRLIARAYTALAKHSRAAGRSRPAGKKIHPNAGSARSSSDNRSAPSPSPFDDMRPVRLADAARVPLTSIGSPPGSRSPFERHAGERGKGHCDRFQVRAVSGWSVHFSPPAGSRRSPRPAPGAAAEAAIAAPPERLAAAAACYLIVSIPALPAAMDNRLAAGFDRFEPAEASERRRHRGAGLGRRDRCGLGGKRFATVDLGARPGARRRRGFSPDAGDGDHSAETAAPRIDNEQTGESMRTALAGPGHPGRPVARRD